MCLSIPRVYYNYRAQNFGVVAYAYQHIRLLGYLGVGLCKFAGISIYDRLIYTYIVTLQQAVFLLINGFATTKYAT